MKKRLLILCVLIMLQISCSSDDSINASKVVGEWTASELLVSDAVDNNQDDVFSTNLLDEMECLEIAYTFESDFTWTYSGSNVDVVYYDGYDIIFDCNGTINLSGTWVLEGKNLIIDGDKFFTLENNKITMEIGNSLPGFERIVLMKQ